MCETVHVGILDVAIEIAFLAIFFGATPISQGTLSGLTATTQYSRDPFLEHIRVLIGPTITGLSENMRIHICPPRQTFRDTYQLTI